MLNKREIAYSPLYLDMVRNLHQQEHDQISLECHHCQLEY